jgi:hypothetical protein
MRSRMALLPGATPTQIRNGAKGQGAAASGGALAGGRRCLVACS